MLSLLVLRKPLPCLNVHLTVQFISLSPKDTSKLHANLTLLSFHLPSVKCYNHFLSQCNERVLTASQLKSFSKQLVLILQSGTYQIPNESGPL